jgi:hypothetical protein
LASAARCQRAPCQNFASAIFRFEREAAAARDDPVPDSPTFDFSDYLVGDVCMLSGRILLQWAPEADIRRMLNELNGDAVAKFRKLLP